MTLRRSFAAILIVTVVPALLAAVALISVTSYLHRATVSIEASIEGGRAAEEMQVALIEHDRLVDPLARIAAEKTVRRHLQTVRQFVASDEEQRIVSDVAERIERYFDAAGEVPADERSRLLAAAYSSLTRLITENVRQGREMSEEVERWDRMANVVGALVAFQLVGATLLAAIWLRNGIIKPVSGLSRAIERYASGERDARAPETGPAELRAIAREFNALASSLRRQQERQLTFLAAIAHDLRNPLAALRFSAEAVASSEAAPSEGRFRRSAELMRRQVTRMERLVDDLLDGARVEAGKFDLRVEPCDLREVLHETYSLFRDASPDHTLRLEVPGTPVPVRCDPVRMSQVLNNLVSNAIKYSPAGGEVRVALTQRDKHAVLSVADHGIGISPEDVERLFEPFQRSRSAHPEIPGVGLGLSVSKKIVEAHQGSIGFESRADGTTFHVEVPLDAGAAQPELHS